MIKKRYCLQIICGYFVYEEDCCLLFAHKKILVTGSSGQVGSAVMGRLVKNGLRAYGMDIKSPKQTEDFIFLQADLTEENSLFKLKNTLEEVEILIHLASEVSSNKNIVEEGLRSISTNIIGTLNLLKYLPRLEQICFSSSYMIYGKPIKIPVNESHQTNPQNIYGVSKLVTEKLLEVFSTKKNITLTILRFMGIYGPGTPINGRAIPTFVELIGNDKNPIIFGNGISKRNHVYIDDAVQSILLSLEKERSGIFNIGGNESISNLKLIEIINEIMHKNIKPIFKEHSPETDFVVDISLAEKELGFSSNINIREGLIRQINEWKIQNRHDI